jgi:hypothetical protein
MLLKPLWILTRTSIEQTRMPEARLDAPTRRRNEKSTEELPNRLR